MHELVDGIVPLEDVLPRPVRNLDARLADASTWEERFAQLDAVLLASLAGAREPSADVVWAWQALVTSHGRVPIGWLCDRLGRSRKQLAVRFREQSRAPPEDRRAHPQVQPCRRTARGPSERRVGRGRLRVRVLRPGAPEPGLPRVRRDVTRRVRAAHRAGRRSRRLVGHIRPRRADGSVLGWAPYAPGQRERRHDELHRLHELRGRTGRARVARAGVRLRGVGRPRGPGRHDRARGDALRRRDDHARVRGEERPRAAERLASSAR